MSRIPRKCSCSGVYHVMLRGNNKQVIFEYENDYQRFRQLLYQKCHPKDANGGPMAPCCVIYSYCLMPNHIHLLIQEKDECVSDVIKSVATSYAQYYNLRYEHCGHLFQGRFRSEPVDDWDYFVTLLRYIHQNPVAGGLVRKAVDYEWSSWREFERPALCPIQICSVRSVLSRISLDALIELVNESLPKTKKILDYDNETVIRMSDERINAFISDECGVNNPKDIQAYSKDMRRSILKKVRAFGGSIRQISRITGISESIVKRAK